MKTKAAVVYEPGKPIEIEELDLDGPREGEVLIRYTHAGLCHSDVHVAHGDLEARLPMVLGHEGAGIIEEVGPGVTRVQGRRPRGLLVHPQLRHLPLLRHRPAVDLRHGRHDPRGLPARASASRSPARAAQYGAMCMLGTFSQYGVIHQNSVRQGRRRPAARQGRARRLRRADRVGLGGQHRRRAGRRDGRGHRRRRHRHQRRPGRRATPVRRTSIAVDPLENKREKAMELGATPRVRHRRGGDGDDHQTSPAARWPTRRSSPRAW